MEPLDPYLAKAAAEGVHALEAVLGADYDGDGKVAGQKLDVATQLERAAALHAAGQLNDAEFQNPKARILA